MRFITTPCYIIYCCEPLVSGQVGYIFATSSLLHLFVANLPESGQMFLCLDWHLLALKLTRKVACLQMEQLSSLVAKTTYALIRDECYHVHQYRDAGTKNAMIADRLAEVRDSGYSS